MATKLQCRHCTTWIIVGGKMICTADPKHHISCIKKRQIHELEHNGSCPDFEPNKYVEDENEPRRDD